MKRVLSRGMFARARVVEVLSIAAPIRIQAARSRSSIVLVGKTIEVLGALPISPRSRDIAGEFFEPRGEDLL